MGLLHRRRTVTNQRWGNNKHRKNDADADAGDDAGDDTTASNRRRQWNTIVSSLRATQSQQEEQPLPPSNVNDDDASMNVDLWNACKTGNIDVVRQIIQHDSPELLHVELQGRMPLYYACHSGQYKVVELLLQSGATDDEFKTCYQSALNGKIRQLLQQYQTVDTVIEFQQKVMATTPTNNCDCPTPTCSSGSSRSRSSTTSGSGFCETDDDMYMHLFDTIETSCSTDNNDTSNNIINLIDSPNMEMEELSSPTAETQSPPIDCSDSLLTERVNNHSVPTTIARKAPTATATATTTTKDMQNQLLPAFMCCRVATLIDSDAMEDRMFGDSSNIGDGLLPHKEQQLHSETIREELLQQLQQNAAIPKSTLTIETSAKRIEVQETIHISSSNSIAVGEMQKAATTSTSLKQRFLQRMSTRRKKKGAVVAAVTTTTDMVTAGGKHHVPSSRSRPRNMFGRWNNSNNSTLGTANNGVNVFDDHNEMIKTSSNGESEIVVVCNNNNNNSITVDQTALSDTVDVLSNDKKTDPTCLIDDTTAEKLQSPKENNTKPPDAPCDNITRSVSGVTATATELSLVAAAVGATMLLPRTTSPPQIETARSTTTEHTTSSMWSFDTFATTEIKKTWIPITTVPVPFEDVEEQVIVSPANIDGEESPTTDDVSDETVPEVSIKVIDQGQPEIEKGEKIFTNAIETPISAGITKSATSPASSRIWNKLIFGSRSRVSLQQQQQQQDPMLRFKENLEDDIVTSNNHLDRSHDNIILSTSHETESASQVVDNSIDSDTDNSLSIVANDEMVEPNLVLNCSSLSFQDRTATRSSSNFLHTVCGYFPDDEVDDEYTLQTMSFDNQIPTKLSLPSNILRKSDGTKQTVVSEKSVMNTEQSVNSRVEQLIHETTLFRSTNSVASRNHNNRYSASSLLLPRKVMSTPTHLSSMSTSIDDTDSHEQRHDDEYRPEIDSDHRSEDDDDDDDDDDDEDDRTNNQSLDEFMDIHTDNENSIYSSTTSESFYDDDEDHHADTDTDDDDDDDYDMNTLETKLLVDDDEISGAEVTSIFCR